MIDPTSLEEQLATSNLTVTLNNHGELCVLSKSGGTPLELPLLVRSAQMAAIKVKEVLKIIQDAVDAAQETPKL
jgi:exosome complex component RRP45